MKKNTPMMNAHEAKQLGLARRGLAFGAFSGAIWGLDGVLLGIAMALAPFASGASLLAAPLAAAALHDGFAAVWLLLANISAGKLKEIGRTIVSRPGRAVMLGALCGGPIGLAGYLLGIKYAGAAYAMAVSATYPAVGALLAMIFLKERISPRAWGGIVLCVAGAAVVGYTPAAATGLPHFKLGIALSLLAALGWGLESVLSTHGMDVLDPDVAINIREGVSFIVYAAVLLPLAGGLGVAASAFGHPRTLIICAVTGLCGAVSYLAWYRALNTAGVGRAMSLNITYAMWGIVYGVVFTGLKLTPTLIAGAALVTAGALLTISNPSELLSLRSAGPEGGAKQ